MPLLLSSSLQIYTKSWHWPNCHLNSKGFFPTYFPIKMTHSSYRMSRGSYKIVCTCSKFWLMWRRAWVLVFLKSSPEARVENHWLSHRSTVTCTQHYSPSEKVGLLRARRYLSSYFLYLTWYLATSKSWKEGKKQGVWGV